MQIRRMHMVLQGNALGPERVYYIQLAFSNLDQERGDLRSPLRDAYITWAPLRDVNVRLGQMKVQYGRQRVVSSSALQMVDRSIVVAELNLDRDVGVTVFSKDLFGLHGKVGYNVGVFGGEDRNTPRSPFRLPIYGAHRSMAARFLRRLRGGGHQARSKATARDRRGHRVQPKD